MKNNNFFWVAFSDLMTSLFFIILVLLVITLAVNKQKSDAIAKLELKLQETNETVTEIQKLEAIENIQSAFETLDENYFEFDTQSKRFRLKTNARFAPSSYDINDLGSALNDVKLAGKLLYQKIDSVTKANPDINYLLIIEGNTMRSGQNFVEYPDTGFVYSYYRALALNNFWQENGIDFRNFGRQCEVILAGSGYFGLSRDTTDEINNRNFTIQITPKVSEFLNGK